MGKARDNEKNLGRGAVRIGDVPGFPLQCRRRSARESTHPLQPHPVKLQASRSSHASRLQSRFKLQSRSETCSPSTRHAYDQDRIHESFSNFVASPRFPVGCDRAARHFCTGSKFGSSLRRLEPFPRGRGKGRGGRWQSAIGVDGWRLSLAAQTGLT